MLESERKNCMNAVLITNLLVIVVFLAFLYSGYKEGFVRKLLGILSFFIVGIFSWYVSGILSKLLTLYPKQEIDIINQLLYDSFNRITLFVILFILLQLLVLLLRPSTRILNHIPVISFLNRIAGCLLGGLQAFLILFLITMGLRLPLWDKGSELVSSSYLRYSDSLGSLLLFYTKEPIDDLQKMNASLNQTQALTANEADHIYQWLLNNNINKEDADKIMSMLRVE